ncbi:MAG: DedA family protein [Campylobacteraceae bacterium]|nr:DedA family protein [Campylobacteraceae bacterium]
MINEVINSIVNTVGDLGYIGIIIMMFLESSFFPFPSEVVMIPAGYLASKGDMNIYIAITSGIFGGVLGALFNYYLAIKLGRTIILKYGKYFFMNEKKLHKIELFFEKYGSISTFVGRLIPGIRQYISLPAGLGKMNIKIFTLFTALGAGIWVVILVLLGYFIGENQALIQQYLHVIMLFLAAFIFIISIIYYLKNKRKNDTK